MKIFYHNLLVSIFLLLSSNQILFANHLIGGELSYEEVAADTYKFTLRLYRDCSCVNCAQFADFEYLTVFNNDTIVYTQIAMPKPPAFVSINTGSINCNGSVPPLCMEFAEYTVVTTLPQLPNGYKVVYQRCCRPNSNNLIADQGTTLEVFVDSGLISNQVAFDTAFLNVVCSNTFFSDSLVHHAEEDSIVYRLCHPYNGATPVCPDPSPNTQIGIGCGNTPEPYSNALYHSGYSYFNPTNNPSDTGNLRVDSITGVLSGTPNKKGSFFVGIEALKNKNNILVRVAHKEFVLSVEFQEWISSIHEPAQKYTVYYNDGYLNIESVTSNHDIEIYSTNGSRVLATHLPQQSEFVDIQHLPMGMYFYEIHSVDKQHQAGKFIKY